MLKLENTLQDLINEGEDPAICLKMKEVAIGHGLPLDVTLHVVCQHTAFITRPKMILYVNDRTQEA